MPDPIPRTLLITGASSGIGAALAMEFARRGCALARSIGLHVTERAPGFIDTDMNRGHGSRPRVNPVERGASIMARLIERRAGLRWVPVLPWMIVAVRLRVLPAAWLAPRRRRV